MADHGKHMMSDKEMAKKRKGMDRKMAVKRRLMKKK